MHTAIKAKDTYAPMIVAEYLAFKADPLAQGDEGESLIRVLCEHATEQSGPAMFAQCFEQDGMEKTGNSDFQCGEAGSLLHVAINAANPNAVEFAQILIQHGLEVNCKDPSGRSILHTAALAGDLDSVDYILSVKMKDTYEKADVNSTDEDGTSILLGTVKTNTPSVLAVVRRLIKAGADKDATDAKGRTALQLSRNHRVKRLFDGRDDWG